jgi:hypothetical protein
MPSPWRITHAACSCYARLRFWRAENVEQATRELRTLLQRVHFVERDRHGRELWRSPRGDGGLRWVVDPRRTYAGNEPLVIWVGQSRPPARLWAPK